MKLASFPLELAKPPLPKAYTRDAYAPVLRRGVNWACAGHALLRRQNLISIRSHRQDCAEARFAAVHLLVGVRNAVERIFLNHRVHAAQCAEFQSVL